jgi:hypothetical protein
MVLEEGDCICHRDVARGGVVQVVEEDGNLGLFEICQQIDDTVDGRARPVVAFGWHCGDGDVGQMEKRMNDSREELLCCCVLGKERTNCSRTARC